MSARVQISTCPPLFFRWRVRNKVRTHQSHPLDHAKGILAFFLVIASAPSLFNCPRISKGNYFYLISMHKQGISGNAKQRVNSEIKEEMGIWATFLRAKKAQSWVILRMCSMRPEFGGLKSFSWDNYPRLIRPANCCFSSPKLAGGPLIHREHPLRSYHHFNCKSWSTSNLAVIKPAYMTLNLVWYINYSATHTTPLLPLVKTLSLWNLDFNPLCFLMWTEISNLN